MSSSATEQSAMSTFRAVLVKLRWLLALVVFVPLAWFSRPDRLPVALGISLIGQMVQTWCFASLVKNRELTIRGPYLACRNPMYLGRYFLLLGFAWLLDNLVALAVFTVGYYIYMHTRVAQEEKRLRSMFGEDYEQYCRDVNRFLPSPKAFADRRVWFFNRDTFFENNAHWNIVLTLVSYAAVYGIWWALGRIG